MFFFKDLRYVYLAEALAQAGALPVAQEMLIKGDLFL
jgi:hypothetical protein